MKTKIINFLTVSIILISISGCSSISKEECQTGDWNGIGYKDGMAGRPLARVQSYIEECGKAGAPVNRPMYEKGRLEGLKIYCTKENGFAVGKDGSSMFTECPANLQAAFMKAFNAGKKVHDLQSKLNNIGNEIEDLEKKIDDPKSTPNEKATFRSRIRDLNRNRDDINRELTRAEMETERG